MITSQIDGLKFPGDVLLNEWKAANLLHPSLARLGKVATLEQELIDKKLGQLTPTDLKGIRKTFREIYSYWL